MIKELFNFLTLSGSQTISLSFEKSIDKAVESLEKNVNNSISSRLVGKGIVGSVSEKYVKIKKAVPWFYNTTPTFIGSFYNEDNLTVLSLTSKFSLRQRIILVIWLLFSLSFTLFSLYKVLLGETTVIYSLLLGLMLFMLGILYIIVEKWFLKKEQNWLEKKIINAVTKT